MCGWFLAASTVCGIADVLPGRTVQRLDAVLGRVLLAQRQRIDAELIGQLVEAALDPVRRVRRAWSAIGGDLGAVADDVVAGDLGVRDVVHRKGAHAARPDRRAREGAGLVLEHDLGRGQRAVLLGAELDLDDRARRRPGAAEHLLAAHHHLDRPAGLAATSPGPGVRDRSGSCRQSRRRSRPGSRGSARCRCRAIWRSRRAP